MNYLFTSESVSEGHPDKVADQISDAILDQFLAFDPQSKVACETLVTTGQVVLAGEVKSWAMFLSRRKNLTLLLSSCQWLYSETPFLGDKGWSLDGISISPRIEFAYATANFEHQTLISFPVT